MLAWVTIRSAAGRPCAAAEAPKRTRYIRTFRFVPYTALPPRRRLPSANPTIPAAHVHRSFRTRPGLETPRPAHRPDVPLARGGTLATLASPRRPLPLACDGALAHRRRREPCADEARRGRLDAA